MPHCTIQDPLVYHDISQLEKSNPNSETLQHPPSFKCGEGETTCFRHKDQTSRFPKAAWRMALCQSLPHSPPQSSKELHFSRRSAHQHTLTHVCIQYFLMLSFLKLFSQSSKHRQPGIDIYLQRSSVQNIKGVYGRQTRFLDWQMEKIWIQNLQICKAFVTRYHKQYSTKWLNVGVNSCGQWCQRKPHPKRLASSN